MRAALLLLLAACSAGDDIPAPRISSLTPDHGVAGSSVTIDGDYFCQQLETEDPLACDNIGSVSFGTMNASTTTYGDAQIIAEVPSGAGSVRVSVTSGGRTSNGVTFTFE